MITTLPLPSSTLEQPLRAQVAVRLLVGADRVDPLDVDRSSDTDDDDPGLDRLGHGIGDGIGAGRMEHDRVDAGGDEVADVGRLPLGVRLPVRELEALHQSGCPCLGLDGAHHLDAPAVVGDGVRDPDAVGAGRRGRRGARLGRRRRRAGRIRGWGRRTRRTAARGHDDGRHHRGHRQRRSRGSRADGDCHAPYSDTERFLGGGRSVECAPGH